MVPGAMMRNGLWNRVVVEQFLTMLFSIQRAWLSVKDENPLESYSDSISSSILIYNNNFINMFFKKLKSDSTYYASFVQFRAHTKYIF